MDIKRIIADCKSRMDKSVEYFDKELRGIRTGRATTALVDYVKIDYYGNSTDLRELAAISVPEPTQLLIKPFDPTSKNDIVKALETADLGLNPQVDGDAIRINVPAPSTERRKQLVGQVKKMAEEARVSIRNERRDANKQIDHLAKDKESGVSEDQAKGSKSEVETLTKNHTKLVDAHCDKKVTEVEDL
ncbi:MAG: ribosome recycling factor [Planctomycetota bacterium]|jgi:ribosome recycling factor